jgi:hypothetical protein
MRLVIVFFLLIALSSCDSRKDYFESINKNPEIKVYVGEEEIKNSVIVDSIKIGFPKFYRVMVIDEESLLLQNDVDEGLTVSGEELKSISASSQGIKTVRFFSNDSFNKMGEKTIKLTCFNNLLPVARFSIQNLGNREIEINATSSYDRDAKFGGQVVLYEYIFNGIIQTTGLSVVRYRFGSSGNKRIELRVKDNSGDWSSKVEIYISIN